MKMDVLLINPPNFFAGEVMKKTREKGLALFHPLGILYLSSVLEEEGIEVKVIDAPATNTSIEEIMSVIAKGSPKIVGISATTPSSKRSGPTGSENQ
jgi:hypothetical protein